MKDLVPSGVLLRGGSLSRGLVERLQVPGDPVLPLLSHFGHRPNLLFLTFLS